MSEYRCLVVPDEPKSSRSLCRDVYAVSCEVSMYVRLTCALSTVDRPPTERRASSQQCALLDVDNIVHTSYTSDSVWPTYRTAVLPVWRPCRAHASGVTHYTALSLTSSAASSPWQFSWHLLITTQPTWLMTNRWRSSRNSQLDVRRPESWYCWHTNP